VAVGGADRLVTNPVVEGGYWFKDGQLLDRSTAGVSGWNECVESKAIGKYEVVTFSTGNIRLVTAEDACNGRVQVLPGEYEPVEPPAEKQGVTVEELAGVWRWDGGEGIGVADFRYHSDGSYEMIRYVVETETLWDTGTFEIDGLVLTYLSGEESKYCAVGQRGAYEMSFTEDGQLQMVLVEDECWRRKPPIDDPVLWSKHSP
jgi:hypothetical protein